MKRFEFKEMDLESSLKKIRRVILKGPMAKIIKIEEPANQQLVITFEQLGKSSIIFDVKVSDTGYLATLNREKIQFTHKLFKNEVVRYLKTLLEKMGAETVS